MSRHSIGCASLTVLVAAVLVCALPAAASSQAPPELAAADRAAIRSVIERQLAAFQRDDAVAAFAYASPTIREIFRTPENFLRMVRRGYPPVYRPRQVEFRELVDVQGEPVQRVLLVGPDGVPMIALYVMQRQVDGAWKINGCYLVPAGDKAV